MLKRSPLRLPGWRAGAGTAGAVGEQGEQAGHSGLWAQPACLPVPGAPPGRSVRTQAPPYGMSLP